MEVGRALRLRNICLAAGAGLSAFVLASCAGMSSISSDVSFCCQPGAEDLRSFRVEFTDMPEFLKPMLRDEIAIVLDGKGIDYTEGDADATILMAYEHNPLASESTAADDMSGALSQGGGSRFVAEIQVEVRTNVSNERVFAGSLTRIHNVNVGSYMHEEPARAAMRTAFTELFADFPAPASTVP